MNWNKRCLTTSLAKSQGIIHHIVQNRKRAIGKEETMGVSMEAKGRKRHHVHTLSIGFIMWLQLNYTNLFFTSLESQWPVWVFKFWALSWDPYIGPIHPFIYCGNQIHPRVIVARNWMNKTPNDIIIKLVCIGMAADLTGKPSVFNSSLLI